MNFAWFVENTSIILSNSTNPFVLVIDTGCVLFEEKVFVIGMFYVFFDVRTLQILEEIPAL
jgi:hypothetical protein